MLMSPAPIRAVPPGERRFGRYTLLFRIASGGMASLYLGHYAGPDGFEKFVAIKRIHSHLAENPEFCRMFVDEARLAARISHPNVVQVLELGAVAGSYFIAMEYINGESLTALLRRTRPPVEVGLSVVSQAAQGLHAAHELRAIDGAALNVVHRDVSPSNLLISYDGAVKVVDFGVAKAKGNTSTTGVGEVKGKFAYIAPEQLAARGGARVDRRADIFALGIVLYEVTTYKRLFFADSDAATADLVLREPIIPPSRVAPDYPPELEAIVLRALERDPDQRFQTAHDLHLELEGYLNSVGLHVLPSTIAELMQATFPDLIEEKAEMVRRSREMLESTPAPEDPSSYLSGPEVAVAGGSRRPWRVIGGLVAAVLVIGASVLLYALTRHGKTAAQPGSGSAEEQLVRVQIRTTPATARILFGDKPVANPLDLRQRKGEGMVKVTITAPGYHQRILEVPLAEGGTFLVELEREAPATQPATQPVAITDPPRSPRKGGKTIPTRPPKTSKTTKTGGKKDQPIVKDLFKNPYDQ